jgi:hypothetical protein
MRRGRPASASERDFLDIRIRERLAQAEPDRADYQVISQSPSHESGSWRVRVISSNGRARSFRRSTETDGPPWRTSRRSRRWRSCSEVSNERDARGRCGHARDAGAVQWVRPPACHAGDRGFEPCRPGQSKLHQPSVGGLLPKHTIKKRSSAEAQARTRREVMREQPRNGAGGDRAEHASKRLAARAHSDVRSAHGADAFGREGGQLGYAQPSTTSSNSSSSMLK